MDKHGFSVTLQATSAGFDGTKWSTPRTGESAGHPASPGARPGGREAEGPGPEEALLSVKVVEQLCPPPTLGSPPGHSSLDPAEWEAPRVQSSPPNQSTVLWKARSPLLSNQKRPGESRPPRMLRKRDSFLLPPSVKPSLRGTTWPALSPSAHTGLAQPLILHVPVLGKPGPAASYPPPSTAHPSGPQRAPEERHTLMEQDISLSHSRSLPEDR